MLTYYDLDDSPNCLKIKILLLELGIPYEQRNLDRPYVRGHAYREKFPTGMAPAIDDGEVSIAESGAIALYLATKHGKLIPTEPERRALMYQALLLEAALVAPTTGGQGLFGELYKPEPQRNERRIAELRERVVWVARVLGQVLGTRDYFAGELSIADIQLYAAVAKGLEAGVLGDAPSNLVAWCERMTRRPAVQAAREQYVHYRERKTPAQSELPRAASA
jgi:glutathione S-transferase